MGVPSFSGDTHRPGVGIVTHQLCAITGIIPATTGLCLDVVYRAGLLSLYVSGIILVDISLFPQPCNQRHDHPMEIVRVHGGMLEYADLRKQHLSDG